MAQKRPKTTIKSASNEDLAEPAEGFLVVGVGASAGGVQAFRELLTHLGLAPGMAIVFVQHSHRERPSLLEDLLRQQTPLELVTLKNRVRIQPGTVYVCPPERLAEVKAGVFRVKRATSGQRPSNAVDILFHSLAKDLGERSAGIILSGTGSDGTSGLKAISDHGGLTFAQEPASAEYDSMPRSAALTGVADHVLTAPEIASELLRYQQFTASFSTASSQKRLQAEVEEAIPTISDTLFASTNHNFQHYKASTLVRRIQRRMNVLKLPRVSDYVAHLQNVEGEARLLFRELLIGVTAFFRDEEAFDALAKTVLPKLFENRTPNDCVRIWVAGCASGQEAYTMAILCREVMDTMEQPPEVQIFATDIDENALTLARAGRYPLGIEDNVSAARLKRFFVKRGKRYQVVKEIRELVLFSSHNLISDPPFSRQDLISCRNLLIYLGPHLQKKLIPLFHYALKPAGFLFLGPSESITSHGELFRPLDAKFRISQRKGTAIGSAAGIGMRRNSRTTMPVSDPDSEESVDFTKLRQRILLDEFSPESCVINETGKVLNASNGVEKYLSIGGGDFQNNIIKMAANGLRVGLRAAIAKAKETTRKVQHENLSIRDGDLIQRVMLTVQPMPRVGDDEPLFMVVFHDVGLPITRDQSETSENSYSNDADSIIAQLELELETTRSDLDKSLQDMEAVNEELKSSNEELLSINEELQSANEELETSKEELRASNDAIARGKSDLENLLRSTQIATVFLDDDLLIRSFTPAIREIYGLIEADVGRPLKQFVSSVEHMPPLPDPSSLCDGNVVEDTVLSKSGKTFIRRILPYQSYTGNAEGIVVTFTDVTDLRQSEARLQQSLFAAQMDAFEVDLTTMQVKRQGALTDRLSLEHAQPLATYLSQVHPDDVRPLQTLFEHPTCEQRKYSHTYRFAGSEGDYLWLRDDGEVFFDDAGHAIRVVGSCRDVTAEKLFELRLLESEQRLSLALDATSDGTWDWNVVTGEVAYSDQWLRTLGYARDEVPAHISFWESIVHPDETATTRDLLAKHFAGETDVFYCENRLRMKSGEYRWNLDRGRVVERDECGKPLRMVGTDTDISIRMKAQLDLRTREQQLQTITDAIPPLIAYVNQDYRYAFVNAGYAKQFNRLVKEMVGHKVQEIVGPEYFAEIQPHLRRGLAGEKGQCDMTVKGSHANAVQHKEVIYVPDVRSDGVVAGVHVVMNDVTDRKRFTQEIVKREAQLASLLSSTAEGIYGIDLSGNCTFANAACAKMLGYDADELIGKPMHDLIHHTRQDGSPYSQKECRIYQAYRNGENIHVDDEVFWRADGTSFPTEYWSHPQILDGETVGCVVAFIDITDRQRAEQDVRDREQGLQLALQAGNMGLWEWDILADRITWSEQMYTMLGYSRDEFDPTKDGFLRIVHDDDREMLKGMIKSAFVQGCESHEVDFRVLRGTDDAIVWTQCRGTIRRDDNHDPVAITSVAVDITERKQQELNLAFIAELQSLFVQRHSTDEILRQSCSRIVEYLGLSRCLLVRVDESADTAEVFHEAIVGDLPRLVGKYKLSEFYDEHERASFVNEQPLVIEDVHDGTRSVESAKRIAGLGIRSLVNAIYVSDERLRYVIQVSKPHAYKWQAHEVDLLQVLANRVFSHLNRASAEAALAESESYLRSVIDNTLNFVGILDDEGTLLEANRTALDAGGVSREDVVGKPFWECYWWAFDDRVAGRLQQAVAEARNGQIIRYDTEVRMAGDSRMTIDFMISPVTDGDGRVTHLIPSGIDISERHAAERRLQESKRRLSMALRAGDMAAWEWTPKKSVWEPALFKLLGIAPHPNPTSELFFECVHPEDLKGLRTVWERATAGKGEYETEFRIIRPDGAIRWLAAAGTAVRNRAGSVTRIYGVNWDVTTQHEFEQSLKEARQQAEAANESKSAFLANMSHEIRTPMTAIMGYADLVAKRVTDAETQEYMSTIRRNGDFLLNIINDILDLSKIEAGKFAISKQRFAPAKIVEDVKSIMDVRARENKLELTVDYRGKIPAEIESDAKRLKQILINLVGNAIKFTKKGGVRIIVRYQPSKLRFDIADSGIGMSKQQRTRLFQPFSQGDEGVAREFGGTGLGLAISQRLANMLGGEISVESEVDLGSTFSVTISCGDISNVALVEPSGNSETEQSATPFESIKLACHVLVVDDRRDIRFLSKQLLVQAGATVSEAEDGMVAVDAFKNSLVNGPTFDLILLDMQMPNLDGYETATQLRQLGFSGPIIALTADAMQGDMRRCLECGCDDYLSKPIDAVRMLALVAELTS